MTEELKQVLRVLNHATYMYLYGDYIVCMKPPDFKKIVSSLDRLIAEQTTAQPEKVDIESLKMKLEHSIYEPATREDRAYVDGYNCAIQNLAATGRIKVV